MPSPRKASPKKGSPKKGGKKGGKRGAKKQMRKKARKQTYGSYIYKVLKQVHPDVGVSRRPCPSWTPSSMISLRELLEKLLVSLPTTSRRQSLPGQSRLLAVWSFLESLPSTPFLREPRLSPSTPAASRSLQERLFKQPAIFIATKLVKELF